MGRTALDSTSSIDEFVDVDIASTTYFWLGLKGRQFNYFVVVFFKSSDRGALEWVGECEYWVPLVPDREEVSLSCLARGVVV